MTYQAHVQSDSDIGKKTPWKYRLAYLFIAWITINLVPKEAAFVTFIGAIIVYPFAMSFLTLSQTVFFKRERTYLWEQWKALPVWGKIICISVILVLPTGGYGLGLISSVISMALTLGIFWFIYRTVRQYTQKGAGKIIDIAEQFTDRG